MNIFQCSYPERLRHWSLLRSEAKLLSTDNACIMIDRWWQQAPLINHYLHWSDTANWPDPWSLLSDNNYCTLTRAVGICYTLLIIGIVNVDLVQAADCQGEEHNLVLVDSPKYVLNFWPDSVISTNLQDFRIIRRISIDNIKHNIK